MTSIRSALDYALLSERQLEIGRTAKFTGHDWRFALYLQLNFNSNTRKIHQYKPSQIAKELGIHPSFIYSSIKKMNISGYAELFIKNKKVAGKLKHTAKEVFSTQERGTDSEQLDFVGADDKIEASMIDKKAIEILINSNISPIAFQVALTLPLNCTMQTGEVDPIRSSGIADMLECHRTSVDRAIDQLNEIGYCQIQKDYVLSGRLPYTAYAFNQNNLKKMAKESAKKTGNGKQNAMAFVKARELLKEAYGVIEDSFLQNKAKVIELAALLSKRWVPQPLPRETQQPGRTKEIGAVFPFAESPA